MNRVDPFQYRYWRSEKLEFAIVVEGKKERVLAGTKEGILARLRGDREVEIVTELPQSELRLGEATVKAVKTVVRLMVGTFVLLDPVETIRKEDRTIRDDHRVEIPLLFDRKYDLGAFLLSFERDAEGQWNEAVMCLTNALRSSKYAELESEAVEFLRGKWNTLDPVCQYTALKIWRDYCVVREAKDCFGERKSKVGSMIDDFVSSSKKLVEAFGQAPMAMPSLRKSSFSIKDPILRLPPVLPDGLEEMRVWSMYSRGVECVVLNEGYYPLKLHVATKMVTENIRYTRCEECGAIFANDNGNIKLCSDDCKSARKKKTSETYRKETADDKIERLYDRTRMQWNNRLRKARNCEEFPPDQLARLEAEFEQFKREMKGRKRAVKEGSLTENAFKRWCNIQMTCVRDLMGEFED